MSDETEKLDKDIRKRIHEIFPSPAISSAIVNLVVDKKPIGWGRKSVAPYYKPEFGALMKKDIDEMLDTSGRIIYKYDKFRTIGISPKTLYQRINQSILYVIEKMDDAQKTYAKWYECVKVDKVSDPTGIIIDFIPGLRAEVENGELNVRAEVVSGDVQVTESMPPWRIRMEDWIESAGRGEQFIQDGLMLNKNEVDEFKRQFTDLGLLFHVDFKTIKLVKG